MPLTTAMKPAPGRRSGGAFRWLAPVRVWQVATWEMAVLVLVLFLSRAGRVTPGVAALAALVLLFTSVRIGGSCLSQWASTVLRYQRRQRTVPGGGAGHPLTALVPDLKLCQHTDRAGNRVGLAVHGGGLTAVVRLAPATRPDPGPLLAVLHDAFARSIVPLAGAQIVAWTAAAPGPDGRPYAAAAPEPVRVFWLALRYHPAQAPRAALARGGGEIGAMRAAASAAVGLAARLDDAGYPGAVLDQVGLGQALMAAVGGSAGVPPAAAPGIREKWRDCTIAGVRQVCCLPDRTLDPVQLLGRWAPGQVFSCVSYTLGRTAAGHVRSEVVVRLGGGATGPGAPRPGPGSAFRGRVVPATGRHRMYLLRNLPLAIGQ